MGGQKGGFFPKNIRLVASNPPAPPSEQGTPPSKLETPKVSSTMNAPTIKAPNVNKRETTTVAATPKVEKKEEKKTPMVSQKTVNLSKPATADISDVSTESQGIFYRCWRKIKLYEWYVGAIALVIPCLFGLGYELPSLGFFQSSKDDSSESSGLNKYQWVGIAAAASTLAYGGYSMLCSSKSTESSRGIFSSVLGPSGNKTSFWQKHGLMIGMLIIGLIGLGLVLWMKSTLQDESDSSESPQWPLGRP